MRIESTSSTWDLLSAMTGGSGVSGESGDGQSFSRLLDSAMQAEAPAQSKAPATAADRSGAPKGGKSSEVKGGPQKEKQAPAAEAEEQAAGDQAAEAAANGLLPPQAVSVSEAQESPVQMQQQAGTVPVQAVQTAETVPAQALQFLAETGSIAPQAEQAAPAAQQTASGPQGEGGIIESVTVRLPEQSEPEAPRQMPAEIVPDGQAQQRFDQMVSRAARQLQQVREPQTQEAGGVAEQPAIQARQAPALPEQNPAEKQADTEQPFQTAKTAYQAPEPAEAEKSAAQAVRQTPARTEQETAVKPAEKRADTEQVLAIPEITGEPGNGALSFQTVKPAYQAPEPVRQVQMQIAENLAGDRMEFSMKLTPESLGKIDVRMVLEGGRLAVEIVAASAKSAETLQRHLEGLASSLRASGVEVQSVQVVAETQSGSGHMDGAFNMNAFHDGREGASQQAQSGSGGARQIPAEPEQEAVGEAQPKSLLDYAV